MTVMDGRETPRMHKYVGSTNDSNARHVTSGAGLNEISGRLMFVGQSASRIIFIGKSVTPKTKKRIGS